MSSTAYLEEGYRETRTGHKNLINQVEEPIESIITRNSLTIDQCEYGRIVCSSSLPSAYIVGGKSMMINLPAPKYDKKTGPFIEVRDGVIRFVEVEGGWIPKFFSNSES